MYTIPRQIARLSLFVHLLACVGTFAAISAAFISGQIAIFIFLVVTWLYTLFNLYVILSGTNYNFVIEEDDPDPEAEETEESI